MILIKIVVIKVKLKRNKDFRWSQKMFDRKPKRLRIISRYYNKKQNKKRYNKAMNVKQFRL